VEFLVEMDQTPPVVLEIVVPDDLIVARLSGRVSCEKCGHPAKRSEATVGDECRRCGGALFLREDDRPETVRNRLSVYREKTAPAMEVLADNYGLVKVDGVGALPEVSERITGVLAAKD
jgi:adenylate kinase